MQQRYVGNSGLRVSSLSLGTMSWARETDEQDASELLRSFVDAGGTVIDTAASYADGQAEALLGAMLGDVVSRSEVVISTKAGISTSDGRRNVDTSRNGMLSGLDASLARLGTDYVDIWFAQAWDANVPPEVDNHGSFRAQLRDGGKRRAGVGRIGQEGPDNPQVRARGDRQKFRQALDKAQQGRFKPVHVYRPYVINPVSSP
jgi:aryl-alcohol dehydrogenase-like predicted oxidoreductase